MTLRGPGLRNDLEIRRTFKCPNCGRTVLKLGDVVSQTCPCTDPPTWMQIQPPAPKTVFKFDKIEIPLTEEDLVIRERPRRIPEPPPEGSPEADRRAQRQKRPKPERRSFESFQEDLAAKVEGETAAGEIVETVETVEVEITESIAASEPTSAVEPTPESASIPREEDAFGEGL
jgi:hypothetical protein